MPICEVIGHRVSLGPVKFFPILGSEIPVEKQGRKTQIGLSRGWDDESGIFAEMVNYETVEVFKYDGVIKLKPPVCRLVGPQVNRDHLTRGHLRWVPEVRSRVGVWSAAEAAQLSGSSL